MPLVSVIMPTRNRCEMLKRAVASVLSQTFRDFELIIVNDGSTDGTAAWLDGMSEPRVLHVNLVSNRGGGAARNEGIRLACGEYVAFLDDDDTWEAVKLDAQVAAMSAKKADVCHTGISVFSAQGRFVKYVFRRPAYGDPAKSIMGDNYLGTTSSVMARKSLVESIRGFDETLPALQDWDFYMRLFKQGCAVEGIDKPLVNYFFMERTENVSFDFIKHKTAADRLLAKYSCDQNRSLLKKGLKLITAKKMLKSKRFFIDALRYYAGIKPAGGAA